MEFALTRAVRLVLEFSIYFGVLLSVCRASFVREAFVETGVKSYSTPVRNKQDPFRLQLHLSSISSCCLRCISKRCKTTLPDFLSKQKVTRGETLW